MYLITSEQEQEQKRSIKLLFKETGSWRHVGCDKKYKAAFWEANPSLADKANVSLGTKHDDMIIQQRSLRFKEPKWCIIYSPIVAQSRSIHFGISLDRSNPRTNCCFCFCLFSSAEPLTELGNRRLLVFWHAKVLIGMKRGARSEPALRLMQQCRLSLGWTELLNLEMTQPEHSQEYLVHQVLLRQRRIIARWTRRTAHCRCTWHGPRRCFRFFL